MAKETEKIRWLRHIKLFNSCACSLFFSRKIFILAAMITKQPIILLNFTGECSASLDYLSELKSAAVDNRANEELMRMICQHDCG